MPRLRAYAHVADAIVRNLDDRPGLPRAAHVVPTWRCDGQCTMCDNWKRAETWEELSTEQWNVMARRLRSLDIVKIIGGEPFLREDLAEICESFRQYADPYILQITTAGYRTEGIVEFLERCGGPDLNLRISLDGMENSYGKVRDKPEAFPQVLETLKAAAALAKEKGFSVGANYGMTDDTVDELPQAIELCRNLGVDLVPGINFSPFLKNVEDWSKVEHKIIQASDRQKIKRAYMQWKMGYKGGLDRAAQWFLRRSNKDIVSRRLDGEAPKRFRCREVRNLAYVMPNGDMTVCGLRYDVIGNLMKNDVEEIWSSERADELRRMTDECPGCYQSSTEIMSRLYCGSF